MSDIKRIKPGTRMSQAVIHNGIVYLAGQVGTPGADIQTQARTALQSVDALLAEAGTDKSRLLQATVWLADMKDFAAANEVWDAWVEPGNPPTRACGEAKLATPDYLYEVIIVAALP